MAGGGEHGPHSIIVSPDGKSIYVIAGNATKAPNFQNSRIPTNWKDDVLLKNYAYGHMSQGKAPGGWVMKLSLTAKIVKCLIWLRNPCDFALNRDGELFIYDADMEWDIGAMVPSLPYQSWRIWRRKWLEGNIQKWKIFSRYSWFSCRYWTWMPHRSHRMEPMPSFQPIIVMHSSFVIGPLPPCIPFISNPMGPHMLAKKENFSPIPTDLLL